MSLGTASIKDTKYTHLGLLISSHYARGCHGYTKKKNQATLNFKCKFNIIENQKYKIVGLEVKTQQSPPGSIFSLKVIFFENFALFQHLIATH